MPYVGSDRVIASEAVGVSLRLHNPNPNLPQQMTSHRCDITSRAIMYKCINFNYAT
jgi:coproporphyrinogen III oxidase